MGQRRVLPTGQWVADPPQPAKAPVILPPQEGLGAAAARVKQERQGVLPSRPVRSREPMGLAPGLEALKRYLQFLQEQ